MKIKCDVYFLFAFHSSVNFTYDRDGKNYKRWIFYDFVIAIKNEIHEVHKNTADNRLKIKMLLIFRHIMFTTH